MNNFSLVQKYYSRKDVQEALLCVAKNREVVGVFSNGNFGKRPNVLLYPNDIIEMVKQGVVSFHGSVERWSNPMALESGMIKQELDKLRIGWDLIIDPDTPDFEFAKLATKLITEALEDHGITHYSVKFSVDYEEPIIIKRNGKVELVKIGKLVDEIIGKSKNKEKLPLINGERTFMEDENVFVCSFNPETLKLDFEPINYVLRHRISENLYEIELKSGKKVRTTGSHSLFVLEDGQIKTKMVSGLDIGDHVLIPKKIPNLNLDIEEMNLLNEFLKLPNKHLKNIYVEEIKDIKGIEHFIDKKWLKRDRVPLLLVKNERIDSAFFEDSYLRCGSSSNRIPVKIKISDDLMRLLGYYVSEGCSLTKGVYDIILSFGSHEKKVIKDAENIIRKIFELNYKKRKPHKSSVQLYFGGKILTLLFEHIFKTGKYSHTKRVPYMIFSLPLNKKIEFLKGYFCDGSIHKNKEIAFKTVSRKLASDLSYLLLQFGIVTSISSESPYKRKFSQGHTSLTKTAYRVEITNRTQVHRIKEIIPAHYDLSNLDGKSTIRSPIALPTNHTGLRYLYKLVGMKRNPKMRSRIWNTEHLRPEFFLETLNYLEKTKKENWRIKILEELYHGQRTATRLIKKVGSKKKTYRLLKELESEGLIKKIKEGKGIGRGGVPSVWVLTSKTKTRNILSDFVNSRIKAKKLFNFLKKLAVCQLGFAEVTRIERVPPSNSYVYDVSVEGRENFVGGFGGVILHNTGGKSFHIGIPFEAFPEKINYKKTEKLYPDLPRKIIEYLKDYTRERLKEELLSLDNPLSIAERVEKSIDEVTDKNGLDPLKVVQIDSMVASSRHMFRLPYSLHEKSYLVSLPVDPSRLDSLKKEDFNPSKIRVKTKFLEHEVELKEASPLIIEALDWSEKHKIVEEKVPYTGPKRRIRRFSKEYFPPCILKCLNGLPDGRKRSVFILTNFLRNMGWDWDEIEKKLMEWNEKNRPSLPKRYIRAQFRWHKRQKKNLLPPNCDNQNFYLAMNVCLPDEICKAGSKEITIKNPVNYPFRKMKKK